MSREMLEKLLIRILLVIIATFFILSGWNFLLEYHDIFAFLAGEITGFGIMLIAIVGVIKDLMEY